jgi:ligand-binding SRPBCC domain-containing protein
MQVARSLAVLVKRGSHGPRSMGPYSPWVPSIHIFQREQRVPLPAGLVFAFYGDAHNLERITPPWLGFEVTTPGPIEMGVGTLIKSRLKLHGVPVRWRTRIEAWEPPWRFVDVQIRGPYSLWSTRMHSRRTDRGEAHLRPGPLRDSVRPNRRARRPAAGAAGSEADLQLPPRRDGAGARAAVGPRECSPTGP